MLAWAPFLAGIGLGGATVTVMAIGGVLRQCVTWATTRMAIASFYVVFAIKTGDTSEIVIHTLLATGFAILAIMGARASAWVLAAAPLVHGIFDISVGRVLANREPGWWGPLRLGIDAALAAVLAVMLWRGEKLY